MVDYARLHCFVSGHVHGVGFRYFTQAKAHQYDLTGWVRNIPDGRVEFVAEGTVGMLNDLLRDIKIGPSAGFVSDVEVKWEKFTGEFKNFRIRL
ncbi:MAG: acylphosphatase [Candidatus Omnitrophota bacterium]|nr:MAG: acylphosphatase [Candidatus Omnitrophota bacterium]